jgi:hypothetical protein
MDFVRRALWILLLLGAANLRAAPENFMVGDFFFNRPSGWQWIETATNDLPVLKIVDASNGVADITFYSFKPDNTNGNPVPTFIRWRNSFQQEERTDSRNRVTYGSNLVVFMEIQGTQRLVENKKTQPRHGYALHGAVIVHPAGNVAIRMIGPISLVKKSAPEFDRMIDDALVPK